MSISELLIRLTIGFVGLFALTRIMGRKEISQMTFFNFVSAIAIGSLTSMLILSQNLSIRNGVIALVGWTIFTLVMDTIDIKSKAARKVTTGDPIIVIKDGKIVERALKKSRLDVDSLMAMLRQKNVFSLNDVDYAVFETNGKISVMKIIEQQAATKKDINKISSAKVYPIPTEVISDGKILTKNLEKLNLDQNWLQQELSKAGIETVDNVFFAQVLQDGTLHIDQDNRRVH
ncbi:DUF421 domain-containing protein [Bacillaceae bacterium S4-13-58]